ncbi:MAG: hypothetical protein GX852_04780 [Clostridiales bacterium]|jgi:tight adherence protein B|nr:hypothetical protein [Clostridiales bacterium]
MTNLNKYELGVWENRLLYVALVICGIVVSLIFYKNIIYAIVIIPLAKKIKEFYVDFRIKKRKNDYIIQFKDFLFVAATSIGAGRSMKEAIGEAIPSLKEIYGEGSVLVKELSIAYERMDLGGEHDVTVLSDFAIASGMQDVIDFITIYSICKTTGASLIIAMNKAATVIIDKITIEKEIEEIVSRKKNEGIFIFAMPIIVIIFLNVFSPDYIAPLYDAFIGRIIMTTVIAANIGIYGIIQKITNISI